MRLLYFVPAFTLATSSQRVAAQTGFPHLQRNRIQPRQAITAGTDGDGAGGASFPTKLCITEPACTSQASILDECAAQYAFTDGRQSYCACTAGFWEASQQCEECLSEAGLEPNPSYAVGLQSTASSICASLSLEYGSASSTTAPTRDGSYSYSYTTTQPPQQQHHTFERAA